MSALFFWALFLAAVGYLIYVLGKLYLRWLGKVVAGWFSHALTGPTDDRSEHRPD